jgi:chromosome segregation ATPase
LIELVERQRATRLSLEERVTRFDEELEAMRQHAAAAAEERALLRQHVAGLDQRIEALRESVEAQRQAVVEHFGMLTRADEESKRRQVDEIERSLRRARDLLVRLDERSAAVSREQPL